MLSPFRLLPSSVLDAAWVLDDATSRGYGRDLSGFAFCGQIAGRFLLFAVDLGAILYLGSLQMTSLRHHRHHHHHHTAIVSAEARGSR
jgi:hypothetical protein